MLLRTIEAFLEDHDMAATTFGRLAAHDPRFVLDLRMGRIPRARTEARIRGWIAEYTVTARKAARSKRAIGEASTTIPGPIAGVHFENTHKVMSHV